MQYPTKNQWRHGKPCGSLAQVHIPVQAHEPEDGQLSSGDFCEDFCCRFCHEFCRDFCSDVRDREKKKKRRKRSRKSCGLGGEGSVRACGLGLSGGAGSGGFLSCFCRRQETCREVCFRACRKVLCEMGRADCEAFCCCFCPEFCRRFCCEFEEVRKRLRCAQRGRNEICRCGCEEICRRICRCVCAKIRCDYRIA